jgi:hypothetical protein
MRTAHSSGILRERVPETLIVNSFSLWRNLIGKEEMQFLCRKREESERRLASSNGNAVILFPNPK